ncbi:MAG TPA: LuxR C-terminal-related transcriptional regulator [Candidatus Dormibacteraeota bacterium]|jgi:DNA-binding CsgD family transcriptional regulator
MAEDRFDLRVALDELRSTGSTSAAVRPEIAASWHRSLASDLQPDRLVVPHQPSAPGDERLERAARPVLDRLVEDLESTSMGLLLADRHGHILDRLFRDRALGANLDRISLAPGSSYQESRVGTNAIGTALEERAPSMVTGSEHFADALGQMACAAAPIFDPITGSVLGVVDLTCSVEGSHSLMLAVAKRSARLIEHRLVGANPAADRFLLERFLRARRGARGALVALNGHTMYTNAPAVKLLHDIDRGLLWDLVSSTLSGQQRGAFELPVPPGGSALVACETVADGSEVIGALLRFLPPPMAATGDRPVAPERRSHHPALGWESLTETERSVAELVSEGRTNREVAASTFLSPHTVGYHLRHIFHKLGVDSRVDLTRLVVQRGDRPADSRPLNR